MPKIDAMLRMMSEKGVDRVLLRSDQPYQIFEGGRCINGSIVPGQQLRQLLEEIVPPSLAPGLRGGSSFHFQHTSPFGTFDLGVASDLGALQVAISPSKSAPAALPTPPISPSFSPPPSPPLQGVIVPAPAPWPQNPPLSPPIQPIYPPPTYPQPNYAPPFYPLPYDAGARPVSQRSKATAGLLALFLPGLGVHRFYLGYSGAGVAFLILTFVLSWFTCGVTAGIAGLWGTIEGIIILCGGMKDAEGRPLF